MESPLFRIKLNHLYVVLYPEDEIGEWGFYDLCIGKKHATPFIWSDYNMFRLKWDYLRFHGINFYVEKI